MSGLSAGDICPICLERLDHNGANQAKAHLAGFDLGDGEDDPNRGEAIWHAFHPACLNQWIAQNNHNCPTCREDIADNAWSTCDLE